MSSRAGLLARRRLVPALLVLALALAVLTYVAANRASGADRTRCEQFRADSVARGAQPTGSGDPVVVIGDSWAAGLGLARPARSWPSRLPGSVHVAGFSGSGFSDDASPCGRVSFADRASAALGGAAEADPAAQGLGMVVVQGGLNDWDRSDAEIRSGFGRLLHTLRAAHVPRIVVVGPASAPSRARRVPRVDALLAQLSRQYGVEYVSTADLDLPYLGDRLHLSATGHRSFGDAVARRISALG